MENQLMLIYNGIEISWFAFFVTVACIAGTAVACVLRFLQKKPLSDIFVMCTFAVPLGLLLSRINYCLFSYEDISGVSDFLSLTNGGFGLYGAFLGVFLAALVAVKLFGVEDLGGLLDCVAAGGALAVTIGRFATRFTTAEVGYPVSFRLFTVYDSSQNVYNLAIYQLDGICEALVFLTCLLYFLYAREKEQAGGKTALLMLALHGANQVVMDSMRSDPLKLGINNFIKISQIIGILCCLTVLVYFMVIYAKKTRFGKFHIFAVPVILLSILLGVVGEYRVGDSDYISKHLIMAFGMLTLDWLTVDFALRFLRGESRAEEDFSYVEEPQGNEPTAWNEDAPYTRSDDQTFIEQEEMPRETGFAPDTYASPVYGEKYAYPSRQYGDSGRNQPAPAPGSAAARRSSFNRHRRSVDASSGEGSQPACHAEEPTPAGPRSSRNPEPIVFNDDGAYTNVNVDNLHF